MSHLRIANSIALPLLLITLSFTAGCVDHSSAQSKTKEATLGGIHYQPPRVASSFTAQDHNGKSFTFGKQPHPLAVVFFGYVSCLDVCPTNLKKFELIQKELGEDADQVLFLFISVDPAQEDPGIMKQHLTYYEGEILGVTGSPEQMNPVYAKWGIQRKKIELEEPVNGINYKYDHTGQIYLVRKMKDLLVSYPYGTTHERMAQDIKNALKNPAIGERLPAVGSIQEVTIPPGAYTLQFQKNPTIPTYIRLKVGQSLKWKNDDYMYHFVGDLWLAPGDSAIQTFDEEGEFYLGCTALPEDRIRIKVSD